MSKKPEICIRHCPDVTIYNQRGFYIKNHLLKAGDKFAQMAPNVLRDNDSYAEFKKFYKWAVTTDYAVISHTAKKSRSHKKFLMGSPNSQLMVINTSQVNRLSAEDFPILEKISKFPYDYLYLCCLKNQIPAVKLNEIKIKDLGDEVDITKFTNNTPNSINKLMEDANLWNNQESRIHPIGSYFYHLYPKLEYNAYLVFETDYYDALMSGSVNLLMNPPRKIVTMLGHVDGQSGPENTGTYKFCKNNKIEYDSYALFYHENSKACNYTQMELQGYIEREIDAHYNWLLKNCKWEGNKKYFLCPIGAKFSSNIVIADTIFQVLKTRGFLKNALFYRDIPYNFNYVNWKERQHNFKLHCRIEIKKPKFKEHVLRRYYPEKITGSMKYGDTVEEYYEVRDRGYNILW